MRLNAAVEFSGPGVASLSMDARFTISNMSTEWGPLVGWFPCDAVTLAYLERVHQALAEDGVERFSKADLEACASSAQGVEERHMTIERISFDDVTGLIASGALIDAKSLIGLLLARVALAS